MRTRLIVGYTWVMVGLLSACGGSDIDAPIECGLNGSCPLGFTCDKASNHCIFTGGFDAPPPDAGMPPDTVLDDPKPPLVSNKTSVVFNFHATFNGATLTTATFVCRLDGDAFKPCASGDTFSGLTETTHVFEVAAVANGAQDPTPASYTFRTDLMAPTVTIDTHPTDPSALADATFTFHSSDSAAVPPVVDVFTCQIDDKAPTTADCKPSGITYPNLSQASHTFKVFATDPAGNAGPPATFTWHVTGNLGVTAQCPSAFTTRATVDVPFTTNIAGAAFTCTLNGDPISCPASPAHLTVTEGAQELIITATAGSIVATATCDFTAILAPPVVAITAPKNGSTTGQVVTFTFGLTQGNVASTTFECTEDSGAPAPCTSGQTFPAMGSYTQGSMHTLSVTATDGAGQTSEASTTFTVGTGPTVQIAFTPDRVLGKFEGKTGTVMLSTLNMEPNVTFHCTLDGVEIMGDCATMFMWPWVGMEGSFIDNSVHTIDVTATDNTTHETGGTTSESFTYDISGPEIFLDTPGPDDVTGPIAEGVSFHFTIDGAPINPAEWTCTSDDGTVIKPCPPDSSFDISVVPDDPVLTISGTDLVGNLSTATFTWLVDNVGPTFVSADVAPFVCPSSTDDENQPFVFVFTDPHPPIRYFCSLDSSGFGPCNPDDPTSGVFAWESVSGPLSDGMHNVEVFARDRFGNPSKHQVFNFVVDHEPPTITIASITGTTGMVGTFATTVSGQPAPDNQDFVTNGAGRISGTIVDNSPITPKHAIINVKCFIDGNDVTVATEGCGWNPNEDPSSGSFSFSFSGLLDENTGGINPHTVKITAEDDCGAINGAQVETSWTIDTTPDTISFLDFINTPPHPVFTSGGAAGPAGDTTSRDNTVAIQLQDAHSNSGNPNPEPGPTVVCSSNAGTNSCPCSPASGDLFNCPLVYNIPQDADSNSTVVRTLTVTTTDSVGNGGGPAMLSWLTDSAAPTVQGLVLINGHKSAPETCFVNGTSTLLTFTSGSVRFYSSDAVSSSSTFHCTLTHGAGIVESCDPVTSVNGKHIYSASFAGLLDNTDYTMTLKGTDPYNNTTLTPGTITFHTDSTPPPVTYVSPADPSTQGGILSVRAPNSPLDTVATHVGTFSTVQDLANSGATFVCTTGGGTGGASGACTTTSGYPLATLNEAVHTAQITATDCVGNQNVAPTINFDVDLSAPTATFTPQARSPAQVTSGSIDIQVTAADNTGLGFTDVADIFCNLDTPNTGPRVRCPGLTGLPTGFGTAQADHSPSFGPQTVTFTNLSPGKHVLRWVVFDRWGTAAVGPHRSAGSVTFEITYPPTATGPGHVVAIGDDFEALTAPLPNGGTDLGAEKVLGNAVFMATAASAFARPINVLLVDALGTATDANNVATGICNRVEVRFRDAGAPRSCACGSDSNACVNIARLSSFAPGNTTVAFEANVVGKDVVVFLDENSTSANLAGVGTSLGTDLTTFANDGGIVIGLNGSTGAPAGAAPAPSKSLDVLSALLVATNADADAEPTNTTAYRNCDSQDALTYDQTTANGVQRIDSFRETLTGARFSTTDKRAIEVYASNHEKNFNCGQFDENCLLPSGWKSIVVHKLFPDVDHPTGPVTMTSFTDGVLTRTDECAGDPTYELCPWAVFYDQNGKFIAKCPLRSDSTATYNLPQGAIALTTSSVGNGLSETQVRGAYNLQPYDKVTLGTHILESGGFAQVNATVEAYAGAVPPGSTLSTYFLNTGCSASINFQQIPGQQVIDPVQTRVSVRLAADNACEHYTDPTDFTSGHINFLVVVRADNNTKDIAYAYVNDVPLTCGNFACKFRPVIHAADYKPVANVQISPAGNAPPNLSTPPQFFGQLSSTGNRELYEERPLNENTVRQFTPTQANAALTSFHAVSWETFNSIDASPQGLFSPYSIFEVDNPIPAPASLTIDFATFLPQLSTLLQIGLTDQPGVHWTSTGSPTHLQASADLGMFVFQTTPVNQQCVGSSGPVQWVVTFPAHGGPGANTLCDGSNPCLKFDTQDSGSVQIPSLPAGAPFDCYRPATNTAFAALGFYKDSTKDEAALRQDAEDIMRPHVAQVFDVFCDDHSSDNFFPQSAAGSTGVTTTTVDVTQSSNPCCPNCEFVGVAVGK